MVKVPRWLRAVFNTANAIPALSLASLQCSTPKLLLYFVFSPFSTQPAPFRCFCRLILLCSFAWGRRKVGVPRVSRKLTLDREGTGNIAGRVEGRLVSVTTLEE